MDTNLYFYQAYVTSVYDGDTCTVDIDLGLGVFVKGEKLRLARINAPELRGDEREAGLLARDFLREKIDEKQVVVETIKDRKGKYGRYLAEIYLAVESGGLMNINDLLVQEGHAVYQEY